VRAVFGAGEHGQAGVDGAALRGVIGDRVAEFRNSARTGCRATAVVIFAKWALWPG
jgi:hypothetical protein